VHGLEEHDGVEQEGQYNRSDTTSRSTITDASRPGAAALDDVVFY